MAKHRVVLLGAAVLLAGVILTLCVSTSMWQPQRVYESVRMLRMFRETVLQAPAAVSAVESATDSAAVSAADSASPAATLPPTQPQQTFNQSQVVNASQFKELDPGYECLAPLPKGVRFHIVMGAPNRTAYNAYDALRKWGLSGAELFTYLRQAPEDSWRLELQLPCGMRHREKLLLPNHGEEGAPFAAHVAAFYDDLPDILVLLHDARAQAWHAECSITMRRLQAAHMGLQPDAPPALRAFASAHRTLNGHRNCHVETCCGPLFCRIATQEPDPTCPWKQVGISSVEWRGQTAICQLRGNTDPATNYTVLSIDVPHFFSRQNDILAGYEQDPGMWGVPITWRRITPPPSPQTRRKLLTSRTVLQADPTLKEWYATAVPGEELQSREDRSALLDQFSRAGNLTNIYDSLFPWVQGDMPHYGAWGLTKIWVWLLAYHGLLENAKRPPKPDERRKAFCCFQFLIPGSLLRIAPRGFYEDLAWISNHKAWTTEDRFAHNIGRLFEYHFFEALALHYTTLEDSSAYVLADQELGNAFRYDECDQLPVP